MARRVGRCRLLIRAAGERDKAGSGEGSFLDRHVGLFLEKAKKPPRRDPRMPARILAGDEHGQLEGVDEA
jgi:hypothetical protein